MKQTFLSLLIIIFLAAATAVPAFAQNCKPIYGGGTTKEQICDGKRSTAPTATTGAKVTPTPIKGQAPKKPTPTPTRAATTKGGLPVVSPKPQKTTPSTGPEVLGLLALAPAAAIGFYLRKKS